MEKLINLQELKLEGNPIRDDKRRFISIGRIDAQKVVKYCQKKASKAQEGD